MNQMRRASELESGLDEGTKVTKSGPAIKFLGPIIVYNFVSLSTQGTT